MTLAVRKHFYHDPIRGYVESMLSEAGLHGLSIDQRAECVAALAIEAQRRVGLTLMEALDDDSKEYFKALMDRLASEEEMAAFFSVRIPDFEERIKQSLADFSDEYLKSVNKLEGADLSGV